MCATWKYLLVLTVCLCVSTEAYLRSYNGTYTLQKSPRVSFCDTPLTLQLGQYTYVTSPLFPNVYPPELYCKWRIYSPTNTHIKINCEVDVEVAPGCSNDELVIYRAYTGSTGETNIYCGRGTLKLSSYINYLEIQLNTDANNNKGRFRCRVEPHKGQLSPPIVFPPVTQSTTTTTVPPVQNTCKCGIKPTDRIVNGKDSIPHEWPWQVSLQYSTKGSLQMNHFCGGTLIDPSWVLTASHCIEIRKPAEIKVLVGGHDLAVAEANRKLLQVSKIIMHPNYISKTVENDIALLKLASPANFGVGSIDRACLPFNKVDQIANKEATATGWGQLSYYTIGTPPVLQKTTMSIVSNSQCKLNSNIGRHIKPNMFCTYRDNTDTCLGDSGGPLNYDDGRWYIIGITSFGIKCALPNYPGVYTEVYKYTPWIKKETGLQFCEE